MDKRMHQYLRFTVIPGLALAAACAGGADGAADDGPVDDLGWLMTDGLKPGETIAPSGHLKTDSRSEADRDQEDVAEAPGAAVDNTYAVGVIPVDASSCPVDSSLVTIYMDDEDDSNESDYSGQDHPQTARRPVSETDFPNTTFRFCKVNGQ